MDSTKRTIHYMYRYLFIAKCDFMFRITIRQGSTSISFIILYIHTHPQSLRYVKLPCLITKNVLFTYNLHLKNINGKSQCYKGNTSLKVHIQYSPD